MRVMKDTAIIILLDSRMCLGEFLLDSAFRTLSIESTQALLGPSLDSEMNNPIPPRDKPPYTMVFTQSALLGSFRPYR
jgi:hypothetical protein